MFKPALFLAGSLLALTASAGFAADLPSRSAPPTPVFAQPPIFSWAGPYIGINAGGAFSSGGNTKTIGSPGFQALGPALAPGSLNTNGSGFIGGAQAGYNFQSGSLVYGVEADIDWLDQKKSASFTSSTTVLGSTLTTAATHNLDYLGTVRGRLGFTPTDRILVFATGGLAYGGVKESGSVFANSAPALAWSGSTSGVRTGFAVGGGAEYALTNNITFKGEYLYYDLGGKSNTAVGNAAVNSVAALNGVYYVSRADTKGSLVRVGLNYKF
jgi:outer membrane immunogenic protein